MFDIICRLLFIYPDNKLLLDYCHSFAKKRPNHFKVNAKDLKHYKN